MEVHLFSSMIADGYRAMRLCQAIIEKVCIRHLHLGKIKTPYLVIKATEFPSVFSAVYILLNIVSAYQILILSLTLKQSHT